MTHRARVVLLALILILSGCLDFERQTVVVTMAPDRNEIHALIVYEGLHVSGSSDSDLGTAKSSLKALFDSKQKFCIFDNWLLCFDLKPPAARENTTERTDPYDAMAKLTRNHFGIMNAGIFVNPDGRLSGWQHITVRNATRYVEAINSLASEAISEAAAKELQMRLVGEGELNDDLWDDLTLVLLQRAARDRHQWLRVEPGRISISVVGSPELFARLKRWLLDPDSVKEARQVLSEIANRANSGEVLDPEEIKKHLRSLERLDELSQFISDNPWSFDQRRDRMSLSLGYGNGEPIRMVVRQKNEDPRNRENDLREYARSLPIVFREQASAEIVIRDFLAAGGRQLSAGTRN